MEWIEHGAGGDGCGAPRSIRGGAEHSSFSVLVFSILAVAVEVRAGMSRLTIGTEVVSP